MDIREIFVRNLRQGVKSSAFFLQEKARNNHKYKSQSGTLERAVDVKMYNEGLTADVFINPMVANYGIFVHQGTKPHAIKPRDKKALRFSARGKFIFAKNVFHKGYKGDPFLYRNYEEYKDKIEDIFNRYTNKAIEEIERGL